MTALGTCQFVPPYLLRQLAAAQAEVADHCHATLAIDERLRTARLAPPAAPQALTGAGRAGVDGAHRADTAPTCPARPVRAAGEPESGDAAVDEAATGVTGSLALFAEVYGRASYDGHGAPVSLTVHYEPRLRQRVLGRHPAGVRRR